MPGWTQRRCSVWPASAARSLARLSARAARLARPGSPAEDRSAWRSRRPAGRRTARARPLSSPGGTPRPRSWRPSRRTVSTPPPRRLCCRTSTSSATALRAPSAPLPSKARTRSRTAQSTPPLPSKPWPAPRLGRLCRQRTGPRGAGPEPAALRARRPAHGAAAGRRLHRRVPQGAAPRREPATGEQAAAAAAVTEGEGLGPPRDPANEGGRDGIPGAPAKGGAASLLEPEH